MRTAFDDRYGCPDVFSLVRCDICDHVMTKPALAESELGRLYSTYYPRKHVNTAELKIAAMKVRTRIAAWSRWWGGTNNQGQYSVKPGEVVLDVGCGSGLSLLEAQGLGAVVYGVEADPNARRIGEEIGVPIHIGSIQDNPFPHIKFDLIVLNQVIEHIPDPEAALNTLKNRLRPTGRIVLVFPNRNSFWQKISGVKWINWHIPYHLHHFNAKGFKSLVRKCGFEIIQQSTITPNIWTLLQLRVMCGQSQLGMPNVIWSAGPSQQSRASVAPCGRVRALVYIFRLAKFTAISSLALFNRLIDMLGLGDSLVVELQVAKK